MHSASPSSSWRWPPRPRSVSTASPRTSLISKSSPKNPARRDLSRYPGTDSESHPRSTPTKVGVQSDNVSPEGRPLVPLDSRLHGNGQGAGGAATTLHHTHDDIIQEVTPDGREVFRWNSWDHLKLSDCAGWQFFPEEYAKMNSLHLDGEGNVIASFRGCSQALKIERPSGRVLLALRLFKGANRAMSYRAYRYVPASP